MSFTQKHRKGIAIVAVFAFFYLISMSAAPLQAAPKAAPARSAAMATAENDNPAAIEKPAETPAVGKKSVLGPIIIGVLAAGAIAAVLLLVVFKTKYDITGVWDISYHWKSNFSGTYSQTFTGDKKSGTILTSQDMVGTYTVDGKDVNWTYGTASKVIVNYTGKFDDKTTMSGAMSRVDGTDSGTWEAHKK